MKLLAIAMLILVAILIVWYMHQRMFNGYTYEDMAEETQAVERSGK